MSTCPEIDPARAFLDGRTVEGDGEPFDVTSPSTGERLCTLRAVSLEQIERAVAAARRSFERGGWRDLPAGERAGVLEAMAAHLEARLDELVELILHDNGKTHDEARIDVLAAAASCRRNAEYARLDRADARPSERGVEKLVAREPVGVVVGITPFNAPLMFAGLKAGPALAAGNSVVLKPSERAPLVSVALCEAAAAAGLPAGVLGLLHGGPEVGAALCRHPGVDMITITGGTRAGSAVMAAAAPTIKNLLLELGGKSAHVLLADADLDRALPMIPASIFRNAGQRCFSGSRLVVEEAIADRVESEAARLAEAMAVGSPWAPETQVGALIDERALADVEAFVARAVDDGCTVAAGGRRVDGLAGSFYRPTVLVGATRDSWAAQEEIFGPVLTVIRVRDAAEAVEVANASRYGLAGAVWSRDLARARQVARAIRAGTVWINTFGAIFGDVPFGGYGHSGLGREGGREGYEAYTELKTVLTDSTSPDTPR